MFTHYEDMKGDKKCKNWGGLGVRGHSRSSETLPFDRAHMTSYSTSTETMRLSCTIFELRRVFRGKLSILTHPSYIGGDRVRILR